MDDVGPRVDPDAPLDAVIVGAGFAGIYALHSLRQSGLTAKVVEKAPSVGGTWYWNRYPGARCDADSLFYCFGFSDELRRSWRWSERMAPQPEILAYLNHVADFFDLRDDILLSNEVVGSTWDEDAGLWTTATANGLQLRSRFVLFAVGPLSNASMPDLEGIESFEGTLLHSADWPHENPDFSGQRVALIGTGSSGIQIAPIVAEQADHLVVFQRTANYVLRAGNYPLSPEEIDSVHEHYPDIAERIRRSPTGSHQEPPTKSALEVDEAERERRFQERWDRGGAAEFLLAFDDLRSSEEANELACEFVRSKIREIVDDPEVADLLCPKIPFGARRPGVGTNYYETFNRDNVELVDASKHPIRFTPRGPALGEDTYEVDAVVCATGFDAFTGSILSIDIRGRDGQALAADWAEGPSTYLGMAVHGFPNAFFVDGPGSPSVLGNVVKLIEQQVEWIARLLDFATASNVTRIEAERQHQRDWDVEVADLGAQAVWAGGTSWYTGANIPGKPQVIYPYTGGYNRYRDVCDEVAESGYVGFDLSRETVDASV